MRREFWDLQNLDFAIPKQSPHGIQTILVLNEAYQYFEKRDHHFFKHFNMNTERVTKYGC